MTRPVINLDELSFDDVEDKGRFTSKRALIGERIGGRDLGYNLTILPPSKVAVVAGKRRDCRLRHMFRAADGVDYYEGEEGCAPDA